MDQKASFGGLLTGTGRIMSSFVAGGSIAWGAANPKTDDLARLRAMDRYVAGDVKGAVRLLASAASAPRSLVVEERAWAWALMAEAKAVPG